VGIITGMDSMPYSPEFPVGNEEKEAIPGETAGIFFAYAYSGSSSWSKWRDLPMGPVATEFTIYTGMGLKLLAR
jgi:hypothetical protein